MLNLTGDIKNFSSNEMLKLSSFLMKMQVKGKLEGIILEILNEKEGLIELDGNKIRVSLPKGVKRGDTVTIRAERNKNNVLLKVGGENKQNELITFKTPNRVEKEEVFHIKIPEKVNIEEMLSTIKNSVIDLKKSAFNNAELKETLKEVAKFIDEEVVKITSETSTKKIAKEVSDYVKKSGIDYESKLGKLSFEPKPAIKADGDKIAEIKELKENLKFKINNILKELDTVKQSISNDRNRLDSLEKLEGHLSAYKGELDKFDPEKSERLSKAFMSMITFVKDDFTSIAKLDFSEIQKVVDFIIKTAALMDSAGILYDDVLTQLNEISSNTQDYILKEENLASSQDSASSVGLFGEEGADNKIAALKESLRELKALVLKRLNIIEAEEKSSVSKKTGSEKITRQDREITGTLKALKKEIGSLIAELSKLKAELEEAIPDPKSNAVKKIEGMIKSFNKLLEGIEYQQLSNLKSAEANINYIVIPTMYDDYLNAPEIVITARRSKKDAKKRGSNDSRVEIFVDLKNAGHIKADFNILDSNITGTFYSVKDETVSEVENALSGLKDSLAERDFNVVRLSSKKIKKAEKCEVNPEERLKLEDINIFDFKV